MTDQNISDDQADASPERFNTATLLNKTRRPAPRVFISYRRVDTQDQVERIHDRLVLNFGKENVFLDVDQGFIPGDDWQEVLRDKLKASDVLLVIIGPKWVEELDKRRDSSSDMVRFEVETGLSRDRLMIVPVLINDTPLPEQNTLPVSIRSLISKQAFRVRRNPDFHDDMTDLVNHIRRRYPGRSRRTSIGLVSVGIILVLAAFWAIFNGGFQSTPPQNTPDIAQQAATLVAATTQAALDQTITVEAGQQLAAYMTQFVTQTAEAFTDTPSPSPTATITPTEDFTATVNAQETISAQLKANVPTNTPAPSSTSTLTPTLTETPDVRVTQTSEAQQLATAQKDAEATQAAVTTLEAQGARVRVSSESANLRNGPGLDYGIIGTAQRNNTFTVIARTTRGGETWYLVLQSNNSYAWIADQVVDIIAGGGAIPTAATIPATPRFVPATPLPATSAPSGGNNPPSISNVSNNGLCASFSLVVTWSDPDGDASKIELRAPDGGVIQRTTISGYGTSTQTDTLTCSLSGRVGGGNRCEADVFVVDKQGHETSMLGHPIYC